jgi:aminopeptidase N
MSRFDPHSWTDDAQPVTRHIDLTWRVDFAARRLSGTATLAFTTPGEGPLDLDARGLEVETVTTASGQLVPWKIAESDALRGDRLRLELPPDTDAVTIRYTTGDQAVALGWLESVQTAGGVHPFLFTQCQPIHARTLVPCQDTPRHRVTYAAAVNVPTPLRAVMSAAGDDGEILGDGRTVWRFDMPQAIPTYLLALAVGNLAGAELGPRSRVYAEPETLERAAWEFAEVERMIQAAEKLFGPYEWDRFDLLLMPPSFPYGGMENPRLTFLTPTLLAGDRSQVNVVAHELAHSWTGNLVTNATMNDFWLNEGFTVYAERRILEELHGREYADIQGVIRRNALQVNLDAFGPDSPWTRLRVDMTGVDPDSVYSLVPYEKGCQLVLLLEHAVGRERFDAFLLDYIRTFRFRSITTAEFIDFLEAKLPGILAQVDGLAWIDGSGMPANELPVVSPRVERIRKLSAGWANGDRPDVADTERWTSEEWQLYLQHLPRRLSHDDCRYLDETYALSGRGNYEILVEWLTIAAGSGYKPALPRLREVLSTVGRMKYLKPLYSALMHNEETAAFARKVFAEVADSYHPLSRGSVAGIVKA